MCALQILLLADDNSHIMDVRFMSVCVTMYLKEERKGAGGIQEPSQAFHSQCVRAPIREPHSKPLTASCCHHHLRGVWISVITIYMSYIHVHV